VSNEASDLFAKLEYLQNNMLLFHYHKFHNGCPEILILKFLTDTQVCETASESAYIQSSTKLKDVDCMNHYYYLTSRIAKGFMKKTTFSKEGILTINNIRRGGGGMGKERNMHHFLP
jgi:hypothetical protein